jgi:hypothetical protein
MANAIDGNSGGGNSESGNSESGNSNSGNSVQGSSASGFHADYDAMDWAARAVAEPKPGERADGTTMADPRPEVPVRVTTAALDRRDV